MATMNLISTGLVASDSPLVRVVDGHGVFFVLDDGREVIDASNTAAPLGHAYPDVKAAVQQAASAPAVNEGWSWPGRETAAQDLMDTAFAGEEDWVGGVRFFVSASEANDLALSLSQALTGRSALATRERAYHGMTGLARDMTVQPHWHGGLSSRHGGWRGVPRIVPVRELPRPRCGWNGENPRCAEEGRCTCVNGAADLLADVAAVILDYSQGGSYPAPLYQDEVASAARRAGAHWIADEVVTGLGRTGVWFNFLRGEARPDMVTLGKPLTGGAAPGGAVVVSRDLLEQLRDESWQTYSTFRGHPLEVAAISATLHAIERDGLVERAASLDRVLREGLSALRDRHPSISRIAGCGLHWTIELHGRDWREWHGDGPGSPLASRVTVRTLEKDVLIATSGEETSLFLAPPLIVTEEELERIIDALDHGLDVADEALAAGKKELAATKGSGGA
jgi:4-aminobutyrate aminotransferase-like enzyme